MSQRGVWTSLSPHSYTCLGFYSHVRRCAAIPTKITSSRDQGPEHASHFSSPHPGCTRLPVTCSATTRMSSVRTPLAHGSGGFGPHGSVSSADPSMRCPGPVPRTGQGHRIDGPELLTEPWGPKPPKPWASGIRTLLIRVVAEQVTGRRVHPG